MKAIARVVLLLLPLGLTAEDIKLVTERTTDGRLQSTHTQYISGNRMRVDSHVFPITDGIDPKQGSFHRFVTIMDCDHVRMISADLDAGEYIESAIADPSRLKTHGPAPPLDPTASQRFTEDVVDTGETKVIFGRQAKHYKVHRVIAYEQQLKGATKASLVQSTSDDSDIWTVDGIVPELASCSDSHRTGNSPAVVNYPMLSKIGHLESKHTGPSVAGIVIKDSTHRVFDTDAPNHKFHKSLEVVTETTDFSTGPLDAGLFQPPPGLRKVEYLSVSPKPPIEMRAKWKLQEWWDELANSFR